MALNSDKIKAYLVPALMIGISLLTVVFGILPLVPEILSSRDEVAALELKRAKIAEKAMLLSSVNLGQLNADLLAAEVSLPADKNVNGLIDGLSALAASAEAKLTGFSTVVGSLSTESAKVSNTLSEGAALGNNVHSVVVGVEIAGGFDNTKEFLAKINDVNRLLGVNTVSFEKDTMTRVQLMVFYQLPTNTLGGVESPFEIITDVDRQTLRQAAQFNLATPVQPEVPTGKPNPFQ